MVDNHDSFVHTLIGYLRELGAQVSVREADDIPPDAVSAALDDVDGVVISPGPGTPEQAGSSIAVVRAAAARRIPLLGVCLGHQAIVVAFGGRVGEAPELMHGMTSGVLHTGVGVFAGIPSPFEAGRYHSLAAEAASIPACLEVTACTAEGTVMGIEHSTHPIYGVQFHPESVLTAHGYALLGNWLALTGIPDAPERGARLSPHRGPAMTPAE